MKNYIVHDMLAKTCEIQLKFETLFTREYHDKVLSSFILDFKALLLSKTLTRFVEKNTEMLYINQLETFRTTLYEYIEILERCLKSTNPDLTTYGKSVRYWLAHICNVCASVVSLMNSRISEDTISAVDNDYSATTL